MHAAWNNLIWRQWQAMALQVGAFHHAMLDTGTNPMLGTGTKPCGLKHPLASWYLYHISCDFWGNPKVISDCLQLYFPRHDHWRHKSLGMALARFLHTFRLGPDPLPIPRIWGPHQLDSKEVPGCLVPPRSDRSAPIKKRLVEMGWFIPGNQWTLTCIWLINVDLSMRINVWNIYLYLR